MSIELELGFRLSSMIGARNQSLGYGLGSLDRRRYRAYPGREQPSGRRPPTPWRLLELWPPTPWRWFYQSWALTELL